MLNHLQIRDFAIVPSLDLEFRNGFTAITGETGAGKSILVDALGLLLGERSDATWVRPGAERAELVAEFSVDNNPEARHWLDQSDLSMDGSCMLRRTINANGRSRAFINGSPVTVAQMQALGDLLVEIHGQNEHMRLTRAAEQLKLLDNSGDYTDTLVNVRNMYSEWRRLSEELENLNRDTSFSANDLEFLNFQLSELQQHDLDSEAITELQTEHDRLAAGESLLETLSGSIGLLEPETTTSYAGIDADIHTALSRLRAFASLDTNIAEACKMLEEAAVNCGEALSSLRVARERVDINPERYDSVASTLSQLNDLARKHHVPMEGLKAVMDALALRIERAGSSEQRRRQLEAALDKQLSDYRAAANQLHKKRSQHASAMAATVTALMAELGMAGGQFDLVVTLNANEAPSPRGDDRVEIRISANPGLPPGPLSKVASGGELSRISLAIKVATTRGSDSVTQIFDEVDAGIGGETANAVGRLIKRLALKKASERNKDPGQALCVTHLAQVAVCATQQLRVQKSAGKDSAVVTTHLLSEDERIDEIARMLSGTISEQSRAHARELLNTPA